MSYKSLIETKGLSALIGNTPDEKIAELAGLNKETVRTYRLRRRIPARWLGEKEVASTSIPALAGITVEPTPATSTAPTPVAAPTQTSSVPSYYTSQIVTSEDGGGKTTTNMGAAQNIITVYTPSQTARTKTKARVTLSIQHGEDSILTLKGKAVHTLFRVLSAHYGRPLPRNGWDD
jgi:hypothetical protein